MIVVSDGDKQMFYVLYSPSRKQYLNEDGDFCKFEDAERFNNSVGFVSQKVLENAQSYAGKDLKFVGPCEEDGEP